MTGSRNLSKEPSTVSITMIGLDTAKSVFQIHAVDETGKVSRSTIVDGIAVALFDGLPTSASHLLWRAWEAEVGSDVMPGRREVWRDLRPLIFSARREAGLS